MVDERSDQDWVAIGRLRRARGIRGELLGELDSSEPGREDRLREVALETGGQRRVVRVEQVWRHDGRPVFKFAGIDSMSDAEPWQGAGSQLIDQGFERFSTIAAPPSDVLGLALDGRISS